MWDIRYRPLKFTDVLGQDGTVQVIKSRLKSGTSQDTSYIFSGGHGQGKTSLARIFARAMLCQNLDKEDPEPCNVCESCLSFLEEANPSYVELDGASKGTVDNMRSIVDDLVFVVLGGSSKRLYTFDEAHRMSRDAQDVLLKPIEEKKMVGIFCTTEPEKIRGTIRSRCEEYSIRKITREDILVRMQMILGKEGVDYVDDAVLTVIDCCDGHVRDIVNKLEMIAQVGPVTVESVRARLNLGLVSTYYEILLAMDNPSVAVSLIEAACERVGPDEVATGMAEAAMNSYRLAHGLFASFVTVDRDLAKRLHQKFGDGIIRLADRFARARYSTRISLVCDTLIAMPGASMALPAMQAVSAALMPVALSAPAPQAPAPQGAKVSLVVQPHTASGPSVRSDGIGGPKDDPLALTELDPKAVPREWPRGRSQITPPNFSIGSLEATTRILTPQEWKLTFEQLWPTKVT